MSVMLRGLPITPHGVGFFFSSFLFFCCARADTECRSWMLNSSNPYHALVAFPLTQGSLVEPVTPLLHWVGGDLA